MLKRLKRLVRGEQGITGLETAIILVAFVVVAAVFSFAVLSAGTFSTRCVKVEEIVANPDGTLSLHLEEGQYLVVLDKGQCNVREGWISCELYFNRR